MKLRNSVHHVFCPVAGKIPAWASRRGATEEEFRTRAAKPARRQLQNEALLRDARVTCRGALVDLGLVDVGAKTVPRDLGCFGWILGA